MQRLRDLIFRFRRDERGVFMVLFAILALVLIATSGAVVDFTKTEQARTRAQTALDSAALALQTQITTQTNAQLQAKAQTILSERLADATITAVVTGATKDTTNGKLNLQAYIVVPTAFVQLVGINSIRSNLQSEVTRGSKDIEVSVALDLTGSMAGSKVADAIDATNSLIDLVVQTSQTPTYSKMAIVPWSQAVNLGGYADSIRGAPVPGASITSATWSAGVSKNITAITRANPGVITVNNVTSLANGDWVYVSGVSGMTQINGKIGQIASINTTSKTFRLSVGGSNLCTTSGCGYSTYSSGGTVQKCLVANCEEVVTTSTAHGLADSDNVYITGTSGMTSFNNAANSVWTVDLLTSTTFAVPGSSPANGIRTSGGTTYCVLYGCEYYYFLSAAGSYKLYQKNSCATERTGTNAFTDAAPSTSALGFNYTSGGSVCLSASIQPLTTNKTTLHNLANSLTTGGSTAGHLGLAWGWYMISPNFGYLWPTASQPAAYGTANLVKAVILMTDGQFNMEYYNGVVAKTSSGDFSSSHINQYAANGASRPQAEDHLCDAIKAPANHTLLFTVGFALGSDTSSLNFLEACATDSSFFFEADTGADLANAFAAIAQQLQDLRVSK